MQMVTGYRRVGHDAIGKYLLLSRQFSCDKAGEDLRLLKLEL
jgi:hypothetical protein